MVRRQRIKTLRRASRAVLRRTNTDFVSPDENRNMKNISAKCLIDCLKQDGQMVNLGDYQIGYDQNKKLIIISIDHYRRQSYDPQYWTAEQWDEVEDWSSHFLAQLYKYMLKYHPSKLAVDIL